MARIAKLYLIEKECADLDPVERGKTRQLHAASVIDAIFARLEELKGTTIPSEPLRKAVDYTLNQREALCRYLGNGWLKPDNNTSENAIRPLCLGRNYADLPIMWS